MALIIFTLAVILYIFVALRVKQWEVITVLGFPTETPKYYLQHPSIYNFVRIACYIVAIITVILSPYKYSVAVGFPIIGLLWFIVNNAGVNRGIKEYRRVMKETREYYETNPAEDGGDFYKLAKQSSALIDNQIYEMYKEKVKLHNMMRR